MPSGDSEIGEMMYFDRITNEAWVDGSQWRWYDGLCCRISATSYSVGVCQGCTTPDPGPRAAPQAVLQGAVPGECLVEGEPRLWKQDHRY